MSDYRTPLPGLLAALLEGGINRVLAMDTASANRLERLQGKCLLLDVEGLGIRLFLGFEYGHVNVTLVSEAEPDTVIHGSPAALFSLAAPEEVSDWGLPGSGVRIEGSADLARDLERLFSKLEPDWEAQWAALLGDTLGYQVASGMQQMFTTLRQAAHTAADQAAVYFRDESGMLVSPAEMDDFVTLVDRLRDGAERLQARIGRLEGTRS